MKRRLVDNRAWIPGAFVSDTTFNTSRPAGINREQDAFTDDSAEAKAADSTAEVIKRVIELSRTGK